VWHFQIACEILENRGAARVHPVARKESLVNDSSSAAWMSKTAMRRALRKSMPFVWALLIGTVAGGFVAALAVFAAHK
jgi:hypothetical protein